MQKTKKLCAYCGKAEGNERDHVPPKCFFPDRSGFQMITVPVCGNCNRNEWYGSGVEIAKDEEYTRNIFVWEYWAGQHPATQKLMAQTSAVDAGAESGKDGAAYRSIMNDGRMRRTFAEGLKFHNMARTPSGLLFPSKGCTLGFDSKRINRVIRKIVRGLYYHEENQIFPSDYDINVFVLSLTPYVDQYRADQPAIRALLNTLSAPNPRRLAGGVFSYNFAKMPTDPARTLWVMSFYDGIVIAVATFPPGKGERVIPNGTVIPPLGIVL